MQNKTNNHDHSKPQYGIEPYNPRHYPLSSTLEYLNHEPEENPHLRDYLRVITKRKWIVLSFLTSVVIVVFFFTLMIVPVYQSTVVLKIDKQSQGAFAIPGMSVSKGGDYYATQYEILKSRALAEKVVKRLNLDKNNNFLPVQNKPQKIKNNIVRFFDNILTHIFSLFESERKSKAGKHIHVQKTDDYEKVPRYLSGALIRRLSITPVKKSQLVRISFESNDPEISMHVSNAIADEYIEYDLISRINANKSGEEFLLTQIEITKKKINDSEKRLNDYAKNNEVVFLNNNQQSALSQQLTKFAHDLSAATSSRIQKEALYEEITGSGNENPIILNNPIVQELTREHANLEAQYINLSTTFTPDFPKMKNLKSQLNAITDRIEEERERIIRSVQSDVSAAMKNEESIKETFLEQQKKVLNFQDKVVQYETLKAEVNVNKELHNNLLQKLNEVSVASMSKATSIQVVDRALLPRKPYKPDKPRNFLLSLIFGLMGGVGLAFLVDYFDDTVKDTKTIERSIQLPTIGMIPLQKKNNGGMHPKLLSPDISNPVSEAFRSIGTFLLFSFPSKPPKTILVTSPGEKEGKTTVSINVASALAESVGKGIIIDADLRNPKLHDYLEIPNKYGLSHYLSGKREIELSHDELVKHTEISNLSIITAGRPPSNPSTLLNSSRMKDLIDSLYSLYNFVIIDAPPIFGMSESLFLSKIVDGTILVVKAGETPQNAVVHAKRLFNSLNAPLLGVILNGVKKDHLKYSYYSQYYSTYFRG
jgi:capsular exopolysaccharide synthesis family protein